MRTLLALLLILFIFPIAVFHRSEAKETWDIDLNKSPPPSPPPRNEEKSQIPLEKPSARSTSNIHEIIGGEIKNMVGAAKIEYNFPPRTTKKEKKKVYNKVRYDKGVRQKMAAKKRKKYSRRSETQKIRSLEQYRNRYKNMKLEQKQKLLNRVAKNKQKQKDSMTETEWQEFKNEYNKKRREKYHNSSIKKSSL